MVRCFAVRHGNKLLRLSATRGQRCGMAVTSVIHWSVRPLSKRWLASGGGYPEKSRSLSDEQQEAIFKRDNRRCRLCGAPATRDRAHIAGSSSDPENLQAFCKPCNMAKARAHFRSATPEAAAEGNAIWARMRATQPVRLCDDKKQWNELQKKIAAEQQKEPRKEETANS